MTLTIELDQEQAKVVAQMAELCNQSSEDLVQGTMSGLVQLWAMGMANPDKYTDLLKTPGMDELIGVMSRHTEKAV